MTTTASAAGTWLGVEDYAPTATPADLLAFFGIPPAPREELPERIFEKRKHWNRKRNKARSGEAVQYAEAVLQAIADAEDALLRGAGPVRHEDAGPSTAAYTGREPQTVDEVWRELERLIFRGRYVEALHRVMAYETRWGAYPSFIDMRNEVLLEAVRNEPGSVDPAVLGSAIDGARSVLRQMGPSEARFLTLVELLEAAERGSEVAAVFAEALRELVEPSAAFRVRHLATTFRTEAWPVALRTCVDLVDGASDDDRGLRGELVRLIVDRAVSDLLPLSSTDDVALYRDAVATAAWIAQGVPEAEAFVRIHRMWASNADQPVFGGNWQWRAFLGLMTFFVGLPLLNAALAKPAWRVLLDGPVLDATKVGRLRANARNRTWFLVTRNAYVQPVHEHARLPWQQRQGQWADLDASSLFDF